MTATMTETDRELIEAAYVRDDDLANQLVMIDEELAGVRPPSPGSPLGVDQWVDDLESRLDYWLGLARVRWTT